MKLLVGYDGSSAAKDALTMAQKYANLLDAVIHVVNSREVPPRGGEATSLAKLEEEMAYIRSLMTEGDVNCHTHILEQGLEPGQALVQYAQEEAVDILIVGIKKRSRMDKLVFGSTAQYIILHAPCPVLTVR